MCLKFTYHSRWIYPSKFEVFIHGYKIARNVYCHIIITAASTYTHIQNGGNPTHIHFMNPSKELSLLIIDDR